MIFRIVLALAGALALAACNPAAQLGDAQGRIKDFQNDYNRGDRDAIFANVGETWRKVSPRAQMDAQVAMIEARLGKIKSSEQSGFNTGFNNGVTATQVVMQTVFEKGEANEVFLFHGSGEEMELVGWQVDSPLLALSPEDVAKLTEGTGDAPPAQAAPVR
ncbi:hypothetical protein [Erythrobacter donghaensis]|uniref:hypothetical protein n=1 Tax=Erythrobacter donghaensis TaxID=267135 RepID=UPI000A37D54B|nr:hypothetical protein [Erythrobacter donghaensis]